MRVEIVDLTGDNIKDAPEFSAYPFSCKYCLYWECPEEFKDLERKGKETMTGKKLVWLQNTIDSFGNCGKILRVDGEPVGYAQYAPHELLPNSASYSASPGDDAVLLSRLYIAQERCRYLMARFLKTIVEELKGRGIKAIETFATKKNSFETPSGPVEFYLRNGFRIHEDDKEWPLMRLDL